MNSTAEQKAALRSQFRRSRQRLGPAEYRRLCHAIVAHTQNLEALQTARTVHAYWPLVERREVDTRPLIQWLAERGTRIVLPVVDNLPARNDSTPPRMQSVVFESEADLRQNQWGVYEPQGRQTVPSEEIDVVIVPALGAGRNGHRIGHGKGYYDVFLCEVAASKICLTFAECVVSHVPTEPHDVPVDRIITEHGTEYPMSTPVHTDSTRSPHHLP